MSKISLACSQCGRKLNAPATAAGENVRCPDCEALVRVPLSDGQTSLGPPRPRKKLSKKKLGCLALLLIPLALALVSWFTASPVIRAAAVGDVSKLHQLVADGADINAREFLTRTTPLHGAALNAQAKAVRFLLANGADVNARDRNGETPLHKATSTSLPGDLPHRLDVVKQLVAHGADVNARTYGRRAARTPLWSAEMFCHKEVAELLREHGATK